MIRLLLYFALLPVAYGQAATMSDSVIHLPLGQRAEVFHDRTGRIQLSDILDGHVAGFERHDQAGFNFGLKQGAFWLKIPFQHTDSTDRSLLVELINPNIHEVSFYSVTDGRVTNTLQSGTAYSFSHRRIPHQNLLYPLVVPPNGEVTCYIRVASPMHSLHFNLLLWDAQARMDYSLYESRYINYFFFLNTTFLVFLGIVLWITRQRRQWSFFGYVLIGILYIYSDIGLGFKNVWPDNPGIQRIAGFLLTNAYLIAGLSFFREYFSTWRLIPRIDRIFRWFMIAAVFFVAVALSYRWLPPRFTAWAIGANALLFTLAGTTVVYVLLILLFRLRRKTETSWFLIGFSLHAVSIVIACLRQMGLYNNGLAFGFAEYYPLFIWTTHTLNMMFWAMLWEVLVVFSLMLYRFKALYEDNNRMLVELADERERSTRVLLTGIERERQRIAQELHDGSGVQLAAIRMKLTLLGEQLHHPESPEKLAMIMTDLDHTQQEIRTVSHNLMPITLSKLGLIPAIEELVNKLKTAYPSIHIKFFKKLEEQLFSETARVNIYRIVQELLGNAIKHASATSITLQLISHEKTLVISIEDDGKGFDPNGTMDEHGIGLQNIRSRAAVMGGQLTIDSDKGHGTFITVSLPLDWITNLS